MPVFLIVLIIVLVVLIGLIVGLWILGKKGQEREAKYKNQIEATSQVVSILVIDKKKMRIQNTDLPQMVKDSMPKWAKFSKLDVVKAKIGPKIVTLIADGKVFKELPVKKECKVSLSGIYISEIKGVRGGMPPVEKKKKKK